MTFALSIGAAFLGGLVLNAMPCVLPVLTLKAFTALEHAHGDKRHQKLHGIAYSAGTISAFCLFAIFVVGLRSSGKSLGWGLQFQHPPFVATLTALVFAFGLNALGVFEIAFSARGPSAPHNVWGSVANGWFAALMATPCSAPFLGTAAALALAAETPAWQTFVIFITIGAGLAFPFTLLALVPGFARLLPRPGAWMETFKHLMGFSLLATALWLFSVLQKQVTTESSSWFLAFLLLLAMSFWALERFGGLTASTARRIGVRVGAVVLLTVAGTRLISFERRHDVAMVANGTSTDPVVKNNAINWVPFSVQRLQKERQEGRAIFLDFTADWCASCKTNEHVFLETNAVRQALLRGNVLPMKADLTSENEEISSWLAGLGRAGIPAYVVYFPDGTHDLLPVAITSELVVASLEKSSSHSSP